MLAVLAFHCGMPGFGGGFAGVDVFFVLSGYLICGILLRELSTGRFSIARFYVRRTKRILPALFGVLLFTLIVGALVLSPYEARLLGERVAATGLSVSNIDFYHHGNYFFQGTLNPLLMTWSLAVEEQFYIVFPLLLLVLFRRTRGHLFAALAALCALSFAFSVFCEFRHPEFNFYMPVTRAWELGAGTLLAVRESEHGKSPRSIRTQNAAGILGIALVAFTVVLYSPATRFPGYEAIPAVLGTILLLIAPAGWVNRLLGFQPLVAIGLISYSLYLWHWPVLSFATIVAFHPLSAPVRLALMLLALILATLSYLFIEQPFRNRSTPRPAPLLITYVSLLLVFVAAGLIFYTTGGLPQRAPQLAQVERRLEMDRDKSCLGSSDTLNLSPHCVPPLSSTPKVALLGDSHSEALREALQQRAAAGGEQVLTLTFFSCPPLQGFTRVMAGDPAHAADCARYNRRALDYLRTRPDVTTVVLAGSWAMVDEDVFAPDAESGKPDGGGRPTRVSSLIHGLTAEIAALEALGKRVVLIDDVPSLPFVPLDNFRDTQLPARRRLAHLVSGAPPVPLGAASVPRSEALSPAAEQTRAGLLALAAHDPGLTVIDAKSAFCNAQDCTFVTDGHLDYTDNGHVSLFGAQRLLAGLDLRSAATK